MNIIIEKTYELIDVIDSSNIIKDMIYYKNIIIKDKKILDLVNKYNNTSNNNELILIKKELYSNNNYKNYIDNYNKLYDIVRKINYKYKKLLNRRSCIL